MEFEIQPTLHLHRLLNFFLILEIYYELEVGTSYLLFFILTLHKYYVM